LLAEPRGGHPSLFADLVVPSRVPGVDAGFIIMELMGYPLISGTNTMSTVIALLETGALPMREGLQSLVLEAPGGLIEVAADCQGGKVKSVTYQAQTPSFVYAKNMTVTVPGWGDIAFDVVWTGAFYPLVDAHALGLRMVGGDEEKLVAFAKAFVPLARQVCQPVHPQFGDEGPLSFVVFTGPLLQSSQGAWERAVCCYEFPRKSVCRSPAGVPSTAATVQLLERGELRIGSTLRTISIFGSSLLVTVNNSMDYFGSMGALLSITGSGWITMKSKLIVNFDDPMTPHDGLDALRAP